MAESTAFYWTKVTGNLASLIDHIDELDNKQRYEYGDKAQKRIISTYSWKHIGQQYREVFVNDR